MKKIIFFVFFVFFSPAVFAGRWPISVNAQGGTHQSNLDVLAMLVEVEGMVLDSETLELGKTRFQSFVGKVASQIRERDLLTFEKMFSRIFFLMIQNGVQPQQGGVRFVLGAFAQENLLLDCDTGCLTVMAILQAVQAQHPHHQIVDQVYLVEFLGHVLLAVRVKAQNIPEQFRYSDARLVLPEDLWEPVTDEDEWVEFVGKDWYLHEHALGPRYKNEPFTPYQGKAVQALSLAACAEWCLESGIQTSSIDMLALDCLQQALELHPTSSNARVSLAALLFRRADFKGALEQYRYVQEIELPPSACLKWGKSCMQVGAHAEAVIAFTRGMEGYPAQHVQMGDGLSILLLARAEAYEAIGKKAQAEADRHRAASILILDPLTGKLTPYGKRD